MVVLNITSDLEFFEVINAFPILKKSVQKWGFKVLDIKEGETMFDFFKRKKLNDDEADILIKMMNREVKHYLKTSRVRSTGRVIAN